MPAPLGVVPGLCTTASAYLAIGSGLFVYLMRMDTDEFTIIDLMSLTVMLVALFFIGLVPWLISKPVESDTGINLQPARKSLAWGTILFFVALFVNLLGEHFEDVKPIIQHQSKLTHQTINNE